MRSEPTSMPKTPSGGCMKHYSDTKASLFPRQNGDEDKSSLGYPLHYQEQSTKKLSIYYKILQRSFSNKLDHPPTRSPRLLLSCSYCRAARLPAPWLAVPQAMATPPGRGAEERPTARRCTHRILLLPHLHPSTHRGAPPLWDASPQRLRGSLPVAELLLLSTRGMVSKLEVINTSGGRRKIPLGFVRELRQRRLSPRYKTDVLTHAPQPWRAYVDCTF